MEVGGGGHLDLPASRRLLVGGDDPAPGCRSEPGRGPACLPRGSPGRAPPALSERSVSSRVGSNQARLNQTCRSRSSSTVKSPRARFPSPACRRLPLVRQLQVAGVGLAPGGGRGARTCAPRRTPARSAESSVGRLDGVLPVDIGHTARRVVLQLLHQGGDEVERLVDGGVVGQDLDHVEVVLERVQPGPGHLKSAGPGGPVVRLVHVPDERYVDRLRRSHPSPGRSSCTRAAAR